MTRIRELRRAKGIDQKVMSIDLGVSQPTISDWESGRKIPSSKSAARLADYFGVSLDYLLGRDEDAKKEPDATHGTELSSGEQALIQLFRRVPSDKRELVLAMIEAALQSGGLL